MGKLLERYNNTRNLCLLFNLSPSKLLLRCAARGRCSPSGSILPFAMATSDLHSSSAPQPLHDQSMTLSSSPLPDLHDLIANKSKTKAQTLRSESAAVTVPTGPTPAFTSASEVLRAARATRGVSPDVMNEPEYHFGTKANVDRVGNDRGIPKAKTTKTSKAPKVPKCAAQTVITLSSDDSTAEDLNVRSDTVVSGKKKDIENLGQGSTSVESKTKAWSKVETPRGLVEAPIQEKKTEPDQPQAQAKKKRKILRAEASSKHSLRRSPERSRTPVKSTASNYKDVSNSRIMNLEPALQRRLDWTPPRPDTVSAQSDMFDASGGIPEEDNGNTEGGASELFKQLSKNFGHSELKAGTISSNNPRTAGQLHKRKAIELISVNAPRISVDTTLQTPSPVKEKAPKRKPRTITEVAMAAYQVKADEHTQDSVKDNSGSIDFGLPKPDDAAKGRKGKAPKVAKSSKKIAAKRSELLSPRSAIRESAAQDFVFGTSSQLAREQSPTFLKELNAALCMSNRANACEPLPDCVPSDGAIAPKKTGRGLWSVSARDESGELVDIELIDLTNSPPCPQDNAILDPWKDLPPPNSTVNDPDETNLSTIELGSRPAPATEDTNSQSPFSKPRSFLTPKRITINTLATVRSDSSESTLPLLEDLVADDMPPPSNQQQSLEEAEQACSPMKMVDPAISRPKYELFTNAKLSQEISRYGFKVVKSRTAMISLLDQCWQSKNQAPGAGVLFSTSAAAASKAKTKTAKASSTSTTTSPTKRSPSRPKTSAITEGTSDTDSIVAPPAKRTRGRPKKVAATDHVDTAVQAVLRASVQERSNHHENPATPAKKRGRPRKADISAGSGNTSPLGPLLKSKTAAPPPVEIKDSDVDSDGEEKQFASPEQLFSPDSSEVCIGDDTEASLNIDPSDVQSTLFKCITKAVTSAPRTTDPSNPSWHEKMLMYDPIILEDLAAWLNSGQLTKVGYDGEVAPADVKRWCELRSICCLWRINVHGRERKRF